jgi:hypothetical protein
MKAIAEKKKAKNIGEFIIYMYQMEDLLRAYQFNMQEVKQYVISHYPVSEEEKEETFQWFNELANSLASENVKEKGHLKSVQAMVDLLAKLHWQLLKTDNIYFNIYQKAKPHIIQMVLEAGENSPGNEIQICLNAIYGLLLAKLRGREIPKDMQQATDAFGDVLSYLNWAYFEELENRVREN